jgi:uncharacterized protein involved in exopolysaccharide biosynthesis/Mrp family chromosome partitioning ATPase
MFVFDRTAEARQVDAAASRPAGSPSVNLVLAVGIARHNFALITAAGVGCGLLAFGAGELLTPRYVATAQIYIDPSAMHGSDGQPIVPGRDSNSFVNYVESQALIAASQLVLDRVVKAQNLDRDPEYTPRAGSSLFGRLMSAGRNDEDAAAAAARALGERLHVERPERTFVLDISISSRDPARAAELANAAARAYIDEVDAMHADAAHQSDAEIAGRLEAFRTRVVEAEKSVEDYKVANGLAGASAIQQQLKDLNDQIVAVRQRMSDAHARADQIEVARRKGGEVGADAAQLDLTRLGPLRAQQAEAHKKFVEAAELRPRHTQVIDAQARLRAADAAVVAEFARLAQIQRTDYAGAKALEASLTRQVDELERQTNANDPSMIGLRDLERKASAARDVYELFVNRSRDTGETKQIEPTGAKIIFTAAPPSTRTFPPNSYLLAGLGFLLGLGLGYPSALRRGERGLAPDAPAVGADDRSPVETAQPPEPDPSPREAAPPFDAAAASAATVAPRLTVGASTPLRTRTRRQSLDRLDLIDLGFPALRDSADATEFEAVLKAVDFTCPRSRDLPRARPRRRFVLVVAGSNEFGDRTALAINLALTAARGRARVVLLDAAGRNAKLTRAVRVASRKAILDAGAIYETENDVCLALPKALDAERGRQRPEAMLRNFLDSRGDALDLIVCDGPGASEVEAASVFEYANAIVALDGAEEAATLEQLAGLGFAPGVLVRFEMREEATRKIA